MCVCAIGSESPQTWAVIVADGRKEGMRRIPVAVSFSLENFPTKQGDSIRRDIMKGRGNDHMVGKVRW